MIEKTLLFRTHTSDQGTTGILLAGFFWCHTLELPWRDNQQNISCIPAGEYDIIPFQSRRTIGGTRNLYLIKDVPGRSGVFIHAGTHAGDVMKGLDSDSLGCPLVGMKRGIYQGQRSVFHSRTAVRKLKAALNNEPSKLIITELYNDA